MCGDDSDLLPKVKVAKRVAVAALVFAILTIVDWAVVAGYSGSQASQAFWGKGKAIAMNADGTASV